MAESIEERDRKLLLSEERYRLLFDRNRVPILVLDPESGAIRDANPAALSYYGYGKEELAGLSLGDIDRAPREVLESGLRSASSGGEGRFLSLHALRSGELRDVELYLSSSGTSGPPVLYCVIFDVTQRRLAEERTAKALEERTLLLREVYHRVKNNLQIVSSLLSIQAEGLGGGAGAKELRIAQERVYTMSLVHELMYQVSDFASIEASDYAMKVVANLRVIYGAPESAVLPELEPMKLELDKAIPFGLVLNELVTNSFKYASVSDEAPLRVSLSCRRDGSREAILSVEDAGPGLTSGAVEQAERSGSLGLSLIRNLAAQLGGEASWTPGRGGKGTLASIIFTTGHEGDGP